MPDQTDRPEDRYARPRPRPYARPRPSLGRYVLATALVAVTAALALWGGLSAQLSSGNDPVLASKQTTPQSQTPQATVVQSATGSDDSEELSAPQPTTIVVTAPASPTPATTTQSSAPTPVQTSTS